MLGFVTPNALRIAISLDCSIILADIEEVKEKKHKNMTMIMTTVKIMLMILNILITKIEIHLMIC